ncbi:MAG TPA: holin [Cellulomonas sp.]
MSFLTSRAFWADLAERVVSTGAAGALTVVTLAGFGLFTLSSWKDVASAAGLAAAISALKAFSLQRTGTPAGAPTVSTDMPLAVDQPQLLPSVAAPAGLPVPAPTSTAPAPAAGDVPASLGSIGLV